MIHKEAIFIIDDEVEIANLLADQLSLRGFYTFTADNGIDALEKLKDVKPNLIILDINMPEMGGVEFYNNICGKNNRPLYPVFVQFMHP